MKYIDADKLIAEIERRIKLIPLNYVEVGSNPSSEATNQKLRYGLERGLNSIKVLITSLQQEQPEESIAKEAIQLVFEEKLTPFKDGNQWCFLLGHNIQEGVCGFGDTILDAAIDFYKDYSTTRIHIGELKKTMEQPDVDLKKEIEKTIRSVFFDLEGIAIIGTSAYASVEDMEYIARHFYELGLNARKEEKL